MAKAISKLLSFFCLFLSWLTVCSSATQVGFSYDARRNKGISSPLETVTILKKNNVSPSQIRVFATDSVLLKTLSRSGVIVDLFYEASETENSGQSTTLWLNAHLVTNLPYVNVTSIMVRSGNSVPEKKLPLILAAMKSIYLGLKDLQLERKVKVSTILPLSLLENSERCSVHAKDVHLVMDFIRKCKSFVVLETNINDALSIEDHYVEMMIQSAISSANLLHYRDVPIVLNVKSSVVPSAVEVAAFTKRMMISIRSHAHISERISGVYAQISPMEVAEQNELNWEEEQIFQYSHRELLDDIYPPTPITIPQLNPLPTVTVPATNPVIVTPTNPIAVPTTTPVTIPPPANPGTSPSMVPPMTVPMSPPTSTNPSPPIGGVPFTPPVSTPTVNPPTSSGQIWCVAKTGATASALQAALDYACGLGGADCSAIQPSGSCFNPNNAQSHASYAFNNYYQKNPVPSSCDFKGAAALVNANPSSGSCIYPTSSASSTPTLSPPSTTTSLFPPPVITSLPPPQSLPPPTTSLPPPLSLPPPTNPASSTPPATTSPNLPPYMLNQSTPDFSPPSVYGFSPPPGPSSSVSGATGLKPLFASIVLVSFMLTEKLCRT